MPFYLKYEINSTKEEKDAIILNEYNKFAFKTLKESGEIMQIDSLCYPNWHQ